MVRTEHRVRGAEDRVTVDIGAVAGALAGTGGAHRAPRAGEVEFGGQDGGTDLRHAEVDAAGQGRDMAEQVGTCLGVVQRPVAAHRQADDGPVVPVGDGTQVGVDEGDDLVEVEGLPVRRAQGGVLYLPVGVPALQAAALTLRRTRVHTMRRVR
ncbi:hypothetical protein ABH925_005613 [Streptacidiphilus sp. EB129]